MVTAVIGAASILFVIGYQLAESKTILLGFWDSKG